MNLRILSPFARLTSPIVRSCTPYSSISERYMAGKIGTHSGKFHADEAFACWMLKRLPQFKQFAIVRTRDPKELEQCDIVVDVGGVYNPEKSRYDHHQSTFTSTMAQVQAAIGGPNVSPMQQFDKIRLSSAGLIYAHYGLEVLAQIARDRDAKNAVTQDQLRELYTRLYKCFVECVDAVDNGVSQFEGTPKYRLSSTLDSQVGHLNPVWNCPDPKPDEQFQKAMQLMGSCFEERARYYLDSWLPARKLVAEVVARRAKVHPSGKILHIDPHNLPFYEHFFEMEAEQSELAKADICMAIREDVLNKQWIVQALPISADSGFQNRVVIPWGGLRDAECEKESGIEGATFVHVNGFIGGAKTKEGVLRIAEETLRRAGKL